MFPPSRLRVLLMSGSMEGGGSEHQTLLLLQHLDRRHFAPELYLTYRRGELLREIPADVPVHAFDDGEPPLRLNWPGRKHHRIVRHLRHLIAERRIDVVYDRTYHMTLVAGPATSGLVGRVSAIVSPPDRDLPRCEPRFQSAKRRRLAAAYRQSRVVLTVSEAVRRSAIDFYHLPPESVQTLRSPVDLPHLRARATADPGLSFEPAATHLACVGRMTWEKGQDLLIDAVSRIHSQNVVLWLVGDGPLRGELERQAAALGIAERVRFTGHLSNAVGVIARCDALVCPSRYEGLPNVVLEAFGLRVPVIATDAGGTGELVIEGQTGRLVPAGDADALARAVVQWLEERGGEASPTHASPTHASPTFGAAHEITARETRAPARGEQARRIATVDAAARLVEREYSVANYLERLQQWLRFAAS